MNWKDEIIKNAKYYKCIDTSVENYDYLMYKTYILIDEDIPASYTTPVNKSFLPYLGGNIKIKFTGSQSNYNQAVPITATITNEDGQILYEKEEYLSKGYPKTWNTTITVKPFQKIIISMSNPSGLVTINAKAEFTMFIADTREYIKILN